MRSHRFLEHTADALLQAEGDSLAELLVACAEGMFAVIVEDGEIREETAVEIAVTADADLEAEGEAACVEDLVHSWLRELLYSCSAEGLVFARFDVREATPSRFRALCHGEPLDPARHRGTEVKAVTYHGFKVERRPGGWLAEVLFDI